MSKHLTTDGTLLDNVAGNPHTAEQAWTVNTFDASERSLLFSQGADYLDNYEIFKAQSITGYSLNTGTGFEAFVVALLMHGATPLIVLARHRGKEQGKIATTVPTRGSDPWPGTVQNLFNEHPPLLPVLEIFQINGVDHSRWRDQDGWAFGIYHPRWS